MSPEPRRPKRLTRLKLHEVSLVPAPANPGARVLLWKRLDGAPGATTPEQAARADAQAARTLAEKEEPKAMPTLPAEMLEYIEQAVQEALAAALPKPPAPPPPARPSAEAELEKLAKSIAATRGLTYHQGYAEALSARPDLYAPAREEGLAKARVELAMRPPSAPPAFGATPAELELAKAAQGIQASEGGSYALAYSRALERNPSLYSKYLTESRSGQ